MITANELRIGNYVKYIYSYLDFSVISGLTYEVPHLDEITEFEPLYDEIEPIPLTDEWLLKFGAKIVYVKETKYYVIDGLSFLYNGVDGYYMGLGKGFSVYVGYVHKLQNLFYEIRNKELKINEN